MNLNPLLAVDGYKPFHKFMSPDGTSMIYSNMTPRSLKHAPKGCEKILVVGNQAIFREIVYNFDEHFFFTKEREKRVGENDYDYSVRIHGLKDRACQPLKRKFSLYTNTDFDVSHFEELWDLGYLPIKVKGLLEGTESPIGVPVMTIRNTLPQFAWITNYLETTISNTLWKPMTSATIALAFKRLNDKWVDKTDAGNDFHKDFGCHDFSMRGMDATFAAAMSGFGHAVCHKGSDTIPVIEVAEQFYDSGDNFVIGSIPATEHSIQCAYYHEEGTDYKYVEAMLKKFPSGPLGIVSDGFDIWKLIALLPQFKDQIMAREGGPVVFRPDSGNPADIVCGTIKGWDENGPILWDGQSSMPNESGREDTASARKGIVELLWDIFGGTTNAQGYKVLHPSVRVIYGDAISLDRFNEINERLAAKGFASTNWVAGVGSFTYQFNTRDTFGFAIKSTYQEVTAESEMKAHIETDEEYIKRVKALTTGINIFKDPITSPGGLKKSAKGLLCVNEVEITNSTGNIPNGRKYILQDQCTWEEESKGSLITILEDGQFYNQTTLEEIRERINQLV